MTLPMPNVGDIIQVPSYAAKDNAIVWYDRKKIGGTATVDFVQFTTPSNGQIFTIEYGAFGVWWSDIEDRQDELKAENSDKERARIVFS